MVLSEREFERHAGQMVHFYTLRVPPLLRAELQALPTGSRIVDVGCGDGQLVWALIQSGALPAKADVLGVDLSPTRTARFSAMTGKPSLLADGGLLASLPDAGTDFCISTMVMEHVPDDWAYARALARITKPSGTLYLTTVLRKRGGWYFRKAPDGRRVLDPTHVREYGDVDSVRLAIEAAGFEVVNCRVEPIAFPVMHPLVRLWNRLLPVRDVHMLFLRAPWSWLERLVLPIPRYFEIQIVARRGGGATPSGGAL